MQGLKVYANEFSPLQLEAVEIFRDYNDFSIYPWPSNAAADDIPIILKNMLRAMMDMHTVVKRQQKQSAQNYREEVKEAFRDGGTPR